jgi:uncharacterized membrane protein YoaK (UPF0700 family)
MGEIAMAYVEVPLKPLSRALRLTLPLAFIAGIVDVVGFVALFGLFTSHFTGNFVVMGQEIVTHSLRLIAELIAIPVFLLVVAASHFVALRYGRKGTAAFRTLLLVQALLLAACMATGIAVSPITDPANPGSVLTAQLGVAAMAVQNACARIFFPGHPSTTVMTINTTQATIDFVDMQRGVPGVSDKARERFEHTAPIVLAFIVGVIGGAYGYLFFSFWCLAIPVAGLIAIGATIPHVNR